MNFTAEYEIHFVEVIERIGLERISQTIEWSGEAPDSGRHMLFPPRVLWHPVSRFAS